MRKDILIKEYEEKYAEQLSNMIVSNLLEINSKDYGVEYAKEHAKEFSVEKNGYSL